MAVRLEKVILDLDDKFSGPAARAAASARVLSNSVDDLGKSSTSVDRQMSPLGSPSGPINKTRVQSVQASRDLDRFTGRMRLLADAAAILGPGMIPIGAIGIPAVAGLAAQMGAAALAGGTALLAFQGVGDTLKAVNEAALEPSAENLEKARIAMGNLGPEAQAFVTEVRGMIPAFDQLRNAAGAGLFPGLTDSLDNMHRLLPEVETILFNIGDALGDLAREGTESLAGPRWSDFMTFLATDVPGTLSTLGRSVGNLAHGLAELWMGFDPLNDGFSNWMLDASKRFDRWADGLSKTEGFQEFVDYVRETGPLVADALGSIGNAIIQIAEAAAPLGGPVLKGLSAVADLIAGIAGSGAGPAIMATVTALAALNRGMRTWESVSNSSWGSAIRGAQGYEKKVSTLRSAALRGGGALAGLGVAATGAADGIGLTNTVSGALLGSLGGPWGVAIGGAIGLMMDLGSSNEDTSAAVDQVTATLNEQTGAITRNTEEWAAKALLDSGALDQASRLGLDLDKVTQAALGNGDAVAYVNEETARLQDKAFQGEFFDPNMSKDAADLRKNLAGVAGTVATSKKDFGLMKEATKGVAGGFRQAASAAEQFKAAVDRAFAMLDKRAALRAAREAVRTFTKTLKDAPKDLRPGTAAFDKVQAALDEIARTSLTAAQHLKGMDRTEYLRRARQNFIDAAQKMGLSKERARELATQLGLLSNVNATPKITVQSNAADIAAQTNAILSNIPDEIVTIHAVRSGPGGQRGGYGSGGLAAGGTVPGQRWPYGDRDLFRLAPGEEVISNRFGQADRHRELLKAINANRYADGGTIPPRMGGSTSVSVGGAQVRVFIDGREVRSIVRSEMSAESRHQSRLDDREG